MGLAWPPGSRPGSRGWRLVTAATRAGGLAGWRHAIGTAGTRRGCQLTALAADRHSAGDGWPGRPRRRPRASAHRFLHQGGDPGLAVGGQLRQGVGGRPHGAFVEVRLVAEAERRVPGLELLRALEEADDVAVLGIGG